MHKFTWKKISSSKKPRYEGYIKRGNMEICIAIIIKETKGWNIDWTTDKVKDSIHKSLQSAKKHVVTFFNETN